MVWTLPSRTADCKRGTLFHASNDGCTPYLAVGHHRRGDQFTDGPARDCPHQRSGAVRRPQASHHRSVARRRPTPRPRTLRPRARAGRGGTAGPNPTQERGGCATGISDAAHTPGASGLAQPRLSGGVTSPTLSVITLRLCLLRLFGVSSLLSSLCGMVAR